MKDMILHHGQPQGMYGGDEPMHGREPTQDTDDFSSRQYFQQANQVMLTRDRHNFYEEDHHGQTDLCFGWLTGFVSIFPPVIRQNFLWYVKDL